MTIEQTKRILHISYESLLTPNGVAVHVRGLLKAFANARAITIRNKYRTDIIDRERNLDAVTVCNEPLYATGLGKALRLIRASDIVHLHVSTFAALLFLAAAKLCGKSAIATFHSIPKFRPGIKNRLETLREILVFNMLALGCDELVFLTRVQTAELGKFLYVKFLHKARVIHGFLDGACSAESKSNPGRLTVVYVGRLEPAKGFPVLLDLLRGKDSEAFDWKIVGDGHMKALLPKRSNVEYLGPLPHEGTLRVIESAHVLLSPSYSEGFGLVVIEAMSKGLAVVASDLPVFRELFGAEKSVLFFRAGACGEAAARLLRLHRDRELLSALQERSRAVSQRFLLENLAPQYLRMYR